MENKRVIEVFTAGCSVCQPAVEMVKKLACSSCEVIVYDLSKLCDTKECIEKAKQYGIKSLPAVAVNGILLKCCQNKGISEIELVNAGIGKTIAA
ncbi:MAG: glutaredoxin [Sphingobacteriales bacterium 46-32]|nr:MAG: glutaredoxin [Sphingobacteriales bacterium 46-32]